MKCAKLKVVLVNLISPEFLVRFQAPLAINVLSGYLKNKNPQIGIKKIDMQEIFKYHNKQLNKNASFLLTIEDVVNQLVELSRRREIIIGLSMKWTTQSVASSIIEQVEARSEKGKSLFVLGNVEVTYGFQQLLKQRYFSDKVAVVGEGEDALVAIANKAMQHGRNFSNALLYGDIANVAINKNGIITLNELKRVNLAGYPNCTISEKADIYDAECNFHAIETSRGCTWGKCTFCAIKGQFGSFSRNSNWQWEPFPIKTVLENIRHFVNQGVTNFDIKDSEFFGPIKKHNKKMFFGRQWYG